MRKSRWQKLPTCETSAAIHRVWSRSRSFSYAVEKGFQMVFKSVVYLSDRAFKNETNPNGESDAAPWTIGVIQNSGNVLSFDVNFCGKIIICSPRRTVPRAAPSSRANVRYVYVFCFHWFFGLICIWSDCCWGLCFLLLLAETLFPALGQLPTLFPHSSCLAGVILDTQERWSALHYCLEFNIRRMELNRNHAKLLSLCKITPY